MTFHHIIALAHFVLHYVYAWTLTNELFSQKFFVFCGSWQTFHFLWLLTDIPFSVVTDRHFFFCGYWQTFGFLWFQTDNSFFVITDRNFIFCGYWQTFRFLWVLTYISFSVVTDIHFMITYQYRYCIMNSCIFFSNLAHFLIHIKQKVFN